jgi:hypothetical protein
VGRVPGGGHWSLNGDVRRAVAVGVFLDYFCECHFFGEFLVIRFNLFE